MSEVDHRCYCIKCQDYKKYEMETYRREGEDTYDFRLCHEHEKALWRFLGEEASFNWEEEK